MRGWGSAALAALVACTPKPPVQAPRETTFAVLGDRSDEPNDEAWRGVLAAVAARQPSLVVTVGDLADDSLDPDDWSRALEATSVLASRIQYTPGNHDIEDERTAAIFAERTGQAPYRSFDHGAVHFVVVDNSVAERWEDLPEAQRSWLEQDLSSHPDEVVVVLMHKPFWALRAARGQPDPMHDLFVRYGVDAVFTGHWHNHSHQVIDGIPYTVVGTSGGAYRGIQHPRRGNAYEYVWVEVSGAQLQMSTVVGEESLPIDVVTLRDASRLRELDLGAFSRTLHPDGRLSVAVKNLSDARIEGAVRLDPGAWSADVQSIPASIEPGATFEAEIALRPGESAFPLPRLSMDYPLPDAGPTPYEAVVDLARELTVPRGPAPLLDGMVGDAEWAAAATVTELTTAQGMPSRADPTNIRLRHDGEALYLSAVCVDRDPAGVKRIHAGRDGHVVYDDRVGLLLAPAPDQLYWVYVTPAGAIWDLHADRAAGTIDRGWDGAEAAAASTDSGWSVEVRIPFAALGAEPPPAEWRFDLRRKQEGAQAEAVFTPAFWTANPSRLGILRLE